MRIISSWYGPGVSGRSIVAEHSSGSVGLSSEKLDHITSSSTNSSSGENSISFLDGHHCSGNDSRSSVGNNVVLKGNGSRLFGEPHFPDIIKKPSFMGSSQVSDMLNETSEVVSLVHVEIVFPEVWDNLTVVDVRRGSIAASQQAFDFIHDFVVSCVLTVYCESNCEDKKEHQ